MKIRSRLWPRSAGARLRLADKARDRGDWATSARLYRAVLDRRPELMPIWVQYGHALKESGNHRAAELAYRRAIVEDGGVADTHLQLGHVLKLQNRQKEAAGAYFTAHVIDRELADARLGLTGLGYAPVGSEAERYASEREVLEREHAAACALLLQQHAEVLAVAEQRNKELGEAREREHADNKELGEAREREHAEAREALELQIYTLRSDLQRAVNHASGQGDRARGAEEAAQVALEARAHEVAELSQARDGLSMQKAELERRITELEARVLIEPPVTHADFKLLQANLLGRVSLVSSDIDRLRRVFEPKDSKGSNAASYLEVLRGIYLDLLENALTGRLYGDPSIAPWSKPGYDEDVRLIGWDWPARAQTMIGLARIRNIRTLVESILEDAISGDLLEAGVWRGGATIYMRSILAAYGITDRRVWVADSFCGLPAPNPDNFPTDAGDRHHTMEELVVSMDEVKANFSRYNLLDNQVFFLPGWFKDTLPKASVRKLALLRLDGDMYESTMVSLEAMYEKVSPGGYVIIDDYFLPAARKAVHDFRNQHSIGEQIQSIDGAGVYWRKER